MGVGAAMAVSFVSVFVSVFVCVGVWVVWVGGWSWWGVGEVCEDVCVKV